MTDAQAELIAYLRRGIENCNAWAARFPDVSTYARLKAKLERWITQVSASVVISDEEAAALDREARVSQYLEGVAVIRSILARRGSAGQAVVVDGDPVDMTGDSPRESPSTATADREPSALTQGTVTA